MPPDKHQVALDVLRACSIDLTAGFHTLRSSQVESLLAWANHYKYRAPKNANGSRARYFHAMLIRRINRKES